MDWTSFQSAGGVLQELNIPLASLATENAGTGYFNVIVGDAPCSAGGGAPLARVRLPDGVGLHTRTLPIETPAEIGSFWFAVGSLAPFCVDAEQNVLVWPS